VGLYHYKARYHNPQAGRFLTQDTYRGNPWQPWTQNLYTTLRQLSGPDVWGYVAERQGSVTLPALAHPVFNAVMLAIN
jgi:hypothetical protein